MRWLLLGQLGSGSNLVGFISLGLVPSRTQAERRCAALQQRALPAHSLLAQGCLHPAALHAAVSTGAAQQLCHTPGWFKNRSDSESPLIDTAVNQADIWLEIAPVHTKPKGEAWEI